jgi:endonuclease/exonuclease/phosphatase family metal-dependent hydrolase
MKLKVMEYNIFEGLAKEVEDGKYVVQKDRIRAAVSMVRKFDPDILVLCEASFTPNHKNSIRRFGVLQNYAKIFNYPHAYYGVRSRRDGTTVLSKYPLKGEDFSLSKMSFVRVRISVEGREIMLDAAHPHPRVEEDDKRGFFKSIIRDRKRPYILSGDFNSISPRDLYDKKKLLRGFNLMVPDDKSEAESIVKGILDLKPGNYLVKTDLQDSYRVINKKRDFVYTNPTNLFRDYLDAAMRLDYIYCSKDLKVLDAGIIKNKLTDIASDHYPIYAVLELN